MRAGTTAWLLAGMLLGGAWSADALADTRNATLVVRVSVTRSCSVTTSNPGNANGGVFLTCTRSGSEPGVVTTITQDGGRPVTRVVPVPSRQTTLVAPRPTLLATVMNAAAAVREAVHQVVTLNF